MPRFHLASEDRSWQQTKGKNMGNRNDSVNTDDDLVEVYSGTELRELERVQAALEAEGLHPTVEEAGRDDILLPGVPLARTFSVFVGVAEAEAAARVVAVSEIAQRRQRGSETSGRLNNAHSIALANPEIDKDAVIKRWQELTPDQFRSLNRDQIEMSLLDAYDEEVQRRATMVASRASENVLEPRLPPNGVGDLLFSGIGFVITAAMAVTKLTSDGDYSHLPGLLNPIMTGFDEGAFFFIYLFPFIVGASFLKQLRRYFDF